MIYKKYHDLLCGIRTKAHGMPYEFKLVKRTIERSALRDIYSHEGKLNEMLSTLKWDWEKETHVFD